MSDDYLVKTRLLMLCNGSNGSTTFTDNSLTPKTVTASGNAQISTGTKKYGTGSAAFDGTGDYLSAGAAANWTWMHLTGSVWTFEAWVSVTNFSAARTLFSTNAGSWSYSGVYININATTRTVHLEISRSSGSNDVLDGDFATAFPNDSSFHHVAITYDNSLASNNATLYIDGVASGTLSKTVYACSAADAQTPARIGGYGTTGNFLGYIDDLRITQDVIRYTGNFTPPAAELPTTQTTISANAFLYLPWIKTWAYDSGSGTWSAVDPPVSPLAAYSGGTAQPMLPALTLSGTSNPGAQLTLPALGLSAFSGATAQPLLPIASLVVRGRARTGVTDYYADLSLPALTLVGYGGAAADLVLPSLTGSGTGTVAIGASAALTLPEFTLEASGTATIVGNAALELPASFVVAGASGAAADLTLPDVTLEASGTVVGFGAADLTLPAPSASGQATTGSVASADLSLPSLMFGLIGYSGAVCEITIAGLTIEATGTTAGLGSAEITLPLFELVAQGTAHNHGSADLTLPALQTIGPNRAVLSLPGMTLLAIGSATVTLAYEAYSLNLSKAPGTAPAQQGDAGVNEITRYTNYPFERIVRYKNSYFGMAADGLFLLEGTTDDGTPISYSVRTAITDFKSQNKKTAQSVYFGGRLGPSATITWIGGENGSNAYAYTTPRDQYAQNHRQMLGKGIKERYYALAISGSGALELDALEFTLATLTRRI